MPVFVVVFLRTPQTAITEGDELTLGPFPGNLTRTLPLSKVTEQTHVTDDITE